MPWSELPGTRRDLPANWPALVAACKKAAGGRCQWILPSGARCPRAGRDADHYGEPWDHSRLRWLCRRHHNIDTQRRAQAAKAPPRSQRRPRPHPGSFTL